MSERPSAPLLKLLRDLVKKKGLNTAAVAAAMGIDRARARKVLAGAEPMLVDELLQLGSALELGPEDLGLPSAPAEAEEEAPIEATGPSLAVAEAQEEEGDVVLDPFGNHPEQLFRAGFALGCDFMFLVAVDELVDSGVPPQVLRQYAGRELPIKLDAAYHRYNDPRYAPAGVTLTLSFDALYTCTFPWSAFKQFVFFPAAPEPERAEPGPGRPVLRLVT